ncbi:hypothetical protein BG004_001650 [Podila humilis]|nr:hypothetical protein BG004_001650 [Podila humilis]
MDEHAPIVYDLTEYKQVTRDWNDDPSAYLTRYYTKQYFLGTAGKELKDPKGPIIDHQTSLETKRGDQYVYQSPNKLCIIGLASTHPLIAQRDRYKVLNLRFDSKIVNALPQPTHIPANSKKSPPPPCHFETVILKIEAKDLFFGSADEDEEEKKKEMDNNRTMTKQQRDQDVQQTQEAAVASEDIHIPDNNATTEALINKFASTEASFSSTVSQPCTTTTSLPSSDQPTMTTTGGMTTAAATTVASPLIMGASSTASLSSSVTSSPSTSSPASHHQANNPRESIDPSRVIFVVRGSIGGHVMELNERLVRRGVNVITDPEVIETMLDKASTHGYIAVIRPKTDKKSGDSMKGLVNELPKKP